MITVHGLNKLGFTNIDDFNLQDDGDGVYIKKWNSDQSQPSEADITTAHDAWQAEYDAQEYARNRATQYPTIGDQLDMLWHAIDTGDWTAAKVKTTDFYTKLKKVKDDNSKPS